MSKKITLLIAFVLSVGFVSAQDVFMKKASTQNQQNKDFVLEKKVSDPLRVEKLVPGAATPSLCSQKGRAMLNEGFEDATFPPKRWTVINGGDANTWRRIVNKFHTGTACAAIFYDETTAHDDYLVTPLLKVTAENKVLTAWFVIGMVDFPEAYDVMVSTTVNNDPAAFTLLKAEASPGTTWEQRSYDLSAYVGQNIYVAFRSTTQNKFLLCIDDVEGPEIFLPENDVEASKLYLASKIKPGITDLSAKVENVGSLAQTFDVVMKIFDATNAEVYSDTINVSDLAGEQDSILVFNTWNAAIGTYTAKLYLSNNAADTNYLNDSITKSVEVKDILEAYTLNTTKLTYNFIDLATGDETEEGTGVKASPFPMSEEYSPAGIYRLYNDKTIGLVGLEGQCDIIDTITGLVEKFTPTGFAYDWDNDVWYVCGVDTTIKFHLYSVDMTTFVATEVGTGGTVDAVVIDMDMAWDGMLYGPSISDDKLYKIDPTTGVITEIGPVGLDIKYGQGVSFNGHEGKLYTVTTLAAGNAKFGYYDLYSGAFVEIKDMGNQDQRATIVVNKVPKPAYSAMFTVIEDTSLVAGVTIAIDNTNLTTDSTGTAVFYGANGTYSYTVTKFGYADVTGSITIADTSLADTINITKLPTFDVTFNIKDTQSAPLDAAVTVYFGTNIAYNGTAVSGTIVFNDVPTGDYAYDIVLDGYTSILSVAFTVGVDTIIDVEMIEIVDTPYVLHAFYTGPTTANFSWNNLQKGFTDDFESYNDFSLTFDPWILKDLDGLFTYGFQGVNFPNSGYPMAGIIFNPAATDPAITSPAHSGTKYVAVFNPEDGSPCNDWLIAPKTLITYGDKVSFWARGGNPNYSAEKFQVFVSTTDTEVSSFVALSPVVTCPANSVQWVQYSYDLSAYANKEIYVAIHVTSVDQFYFCLDDFKIGQAKSQSKAFVGYNVFVDGTKVASDVTEENYELTDLVLGTTYQLGVQSIYTTDTSGIVTIDYYHFNTAVNDLDKNNIEMYPNPSNGTFFVNVNGSYNVEVIDITGKVVKSQIINNNGIISLDNSGLYIVKFSNENETLIKKVIVK